MAKRKTRSMNMDVNQTNTTEPDLPKRKRFRNKKSCASKLSFDQQNVSDTHVDEFVSIPSKLTSFDQYEDMNDRENSPPPLVVDTEQCSTQSIISDFFPRTEPLGERLPRVTSSSIDQTAMNISHGSTSVMSNLDRLHENNLVPVVNRSTEAHFPSNIRSQSSTLGIVVSVDQRQTVPIRNFDHNQRTSTPIRPSRQSQVNSTLNDDCNDLFTVESIPRDTYELLSRFPEFRRLVKAFNSEKKKSSTWSKDFTRLQTSYRQLEENSFPRPPAVALSYLIDLVTQIQLSGGRGDPRSDEQIASDLGETPIFLMGLKDVSPQQTALNLFNHLFPGYEAKIKLGSISNLEIDRPGLLETILVFSQRSAPGTNYKLHELRDALNNSIRGARYHWRRINRNIVHAVGINNGNDHDHEMIDD